MVEANRTTITYMRCTLALLLLLICQWLQAQDQLDQISSVVQDSLVSKYGKKQDIDATLGLLQIDSLLQTKAQLLQERINHLESKATGKLQTLDSLSNIQASSFLDDKLKDLTPEQYTAKLKDVNQSLETYQSQITDSEELAWIEHYSGQLEQLEGVVSKYQNKLLNLEELQDLKGYSQQLQQLSQESSSYFKEVQDILPSSLTDESPLMKQLESKIGHYPEFRELQKVTAELEQVRSLPKDQQDQLKTYQDPDKVKSQAQELVNEHFSQHQDKLQAAQQKLATFKKKYSSIQTTKDMSTAVKRNSLEGKPLSERLVLGGMFQVNKDPTSVDLSPLLGYRFNKKYTLGIGATYRAVLDFDNFETTDQVYGYRGFFQRDVVKGFFLHGEYERMNTAAESSSASTAPTDEAYRRWKSGALVGAGKEYSFVKGIKGQVMVLYDFLHEDGVSPYKKPLVIRFGFVL